MIVKRSRNQSGRRRIGRRPEREAEAPVEWDAPADWTMTVDWTPGSAPPPMVKAEPLSARLIVALLALAVLAASVAATGWRYRTRSIFSTRTVTATGLGIDAGGCPVGGICDLSPEPPLGLTDAVGAVFPAATQLSASSTVLESTQVVYGSSISVMTSAGVLVSVSAQCLPSDVALTSRRAVSGSDAAIVVAGAPGCSVAVAAHAPPRVPLPVAALDKLARDPRARLGD